MGQQETFSYDANGRQDRHVDFEGRTTDFVYDQLGRLDLKEFFAAGNDPDGTPDETVDYVYDKLGRQTDLTDARGPSSWDYDAVGRVTKVQSPEGIVNYVYDPVTGRRSHTWTGSDPLAPLSKTEYLYDVLGRLETVRLLTREGQAVSPPEETVYHYDILGNLVQTDLPNGVISDYHYDQLGRLELLEHFLDANGNESYDEGTDTLLGSFDYELLLDGRRAAVEETDDLGNVTFYDWEYDAAGRLVFEERYQANAPADSYAASYTYDLVGNRIKKETDNDAIAGIDETISYVYDPNDRLLTEYNDQADTTTVYEYGGPTNPHTEQTNKTVWQGTNTDPATGTEDSETTFVYNLQGRLEGAVIVDHQTGTTTITSYKYNDSGIRVEQRKQVDGGVEEVTTYLIDAYNATGYAQVLEEYVDAQLAKTYTLGHDVISQSDGTVYHLEYDAHGSTRALLDSAGAVVERYAYDGYGNAVGFDAASALTTILYSGEQFDVAIDQQYLRARYYDAAVGRFNRLDPFAGDQTHPLTFHEYAYVSGDPVGYIDPSGELAGLIGGLGSFLTGMYIRTLDVTARTLPALSAIAFQLQFLAHHVLTAIPRIEFYLTATVTSLAFLEGATEAWIRNNQTMPNAAGATPQENWARGTALEGRTPANLGGNFEAIDDFRHGHATSVKTHGVATQERLVAAIRKDLRAIDGIENRELRGTTNAGVFHRIRAGSIQSKGLLVGIPQNQAAWLTPAFRQQITNMAQRFKTVIRVVPVRNWRR